MLNPTLLPLLSPLSSVLLLGQAQILQNNFLKLAMFAVSAIILFVFVLILFSYGRLWLRAFASRAQVRMVDLIGMTLRKVQSRTIVDAKIMAMQAGIETHPELGITTRRLEAHYLAGGNVPRVINAVIAGRVCCGIDLRTVQHTIRIFVINPTITIVV